MSSALIILLLLAIAAGVVVVIVRRQPAAPPAGPQEGDTAWNDPVTPGEPARPTGRPDAFAADAPPTGDPRP
ncbi:hypothetical protein [Brevundimonas sp. Root1423]|uniref:hypothetical protein n=1 Tax=Brevundimonas sp. Root1423 TaxID=1736462 RepID=UPI0006FB4913|nr:hypothetical protein [Brevundimonas sp. Root1423]KQY84578.1 hypothetical protein ASD25_05895 [Brevundimonas sp. Root1423]